MQYIPTITIPSNVSHAVRAYLECAEWVGTESSDVLDGIEWSPTAVAAATEVVNGLLYSTDPGISTEVAHYLKRYGEPQFGHDVWLTRCGHGTGFWDRGLDTRRGYPLLTAMAAAYGDENVWIDYDNGLAEFG